MRAVRRDDGIYTGLTTVGGATFDTTGVLGLSRGPSGQLEARGFPDWITLPTYRDLATGRRWHFFFAWAFVLNGLAYLVYAPPQRARAPRPRAVAAAICAASADSVWEHVRFRFPKGEEAKRYNVLQKLAYLAVIFGLLPLMILTGLTMSPALDAGLPRAARCLRRAPVGAHHSLPVRLRASCCSCSCTCSWCSSRALWNNLRSMITGRYAIAAAEDPHAQ